MSTLKRHGFKTTVGVTVAIGGLAAGLALWGGPSAPTVDAASAKVPKPAKNVIVMISDGWGYNHIAATDYYGGRKQGYESFPVRLAMSTYEIENVSVSGGAAQDKLLGYDPVLFWNDFAYAEAPLATDSASAATAMASGTKTYNGAIGVDISKQDLTLITEAAEKKGKATGVVTSVEFSHATPAGFVAHNTSRNNYAEIANEMILDSATDVIMGCGAPDYDDSGNPLAPGSFNTYKYVGGETTWSDITDDLIVTGADADNDGDDDDWTVIRDRRDFQKMAFGPTPSRVLGIPGVYTTLQQARAGDGKADPCQIPLTETVPSLPEMSRAALNVLDNDKDGFFLMIEGGAVDWAGHANQTGRLIEEQTDFDKTVEAVMAWVARYSNWDETLLIVTGDHETGNLWGPGSGMVDGVAKYAPIINKGPGKVPGVQWNSGDHTNQLIPLFAKGKSADFLKTYVRASDPVRGAYIDNTDLAELLFRVTK